MSIQPTTFRPSGSAQHAASSFDWWAAIGRVVSSVESLRDGSALYALLITLAAAGLAFACAQASLGRGDVSWAIGQGAAALFLAFYGSNAAGLLVMDRAMARPQRDAIQAFEDALGIAHRVLLSLLVVLFGAAVLSAGVWSLFWLCSLPHVGPWLFVGVVPLTVLLLGMGLVAGAAVVGPLTGPSIWAGATAWQSPQILWRLMRQRLLQASVLMAALSVLTGLVGAAATAVVFAGGRIMAQLSIWLLDVDVAPELFMAGLFGHSLSGVQVPNVSATAMTYLSAASVGGGMVFGLALVLPTLVYLRGVCEIYVTLNGVQDSEV